MILPDITITCPQCGIAFAIGKHFYESLLAEERSIVCPNGHEMGWDPPASAELADRQRLQTLAQDLRAARRENAALKGQLVDARRQCELAEARLTTSASHTQSPRPSAAHTAASASSWCRRPPAD